MTILDKLNKLLEKEYIYIYQEMEDIQMINLNYQNKKVNHSFVTKNGIACTITARVNDNLHFVIYRSKNGK